MINSLSSLVKLAPRKKKSNVLFRKVLSGASCLCSFNINDISTASTQTGTLLFADDPYVFFSQLDINQAGTDSFAI